MKKLHLGIAFFGILLVGAVIITIGSGALLGTADADAPVPDGESHSDGLGSVSVEDVSVRNRAAEGVLYLDITVAGDLDTERLGRSLERLYDDPTVNVSTVELVSVERNVTTTGDTRGEEPDTSVQRNVVTVAVVTDDRSSSVHVVNRVEHYLDDTNWDEQPSESTVQADASDSAASSTDTVCKPATVFYQLDFVQGEIIENLRGPEGYYTPDELIRFAHGSSHQPIVRASDGEFTTNPTLRRGVESGQITVEDGTATVTFSIAAGHGPVELTLASYEKPGSGWSPETEEEQVLVDYDTETFGPGGPYTLRVSLPEAEAEPCETTETSATAPLADAQTDIPAGTTTVRTPPSASSSTSPPSSSAPTEIPPTETLAPSTPTPTGTRAVLDLEVGGNGQSLPFNFGPVQNGRQYSTVLQLRNVGNTPGNCLCAEITDVGGSENERKEPERDPGVHDRPGSELPQYLSVRMAVDDQNGEYRRFYAQTSLTAENKKQCVSLDDGLGRGNPVNLHIVVGVAHEDISNAMSDSATFTIELTLHDENPNS